RAWRIKVVCWSLCYHGQRNWEVNGILFFIYSSEENAIQALTMDGKDLGGIQIRVSYANERHPWNFGGGGYNNGGGGYGDGG
ncbi:hypothetical protein MKX03_037574, partial [Papaver bracteatum]